MSSSFSSPSLLKTWKQQAVQRLIQSGIESEEARVEINLFFKDILEIPLHIEISHPEYTLTSVQLQKAESFVQKRQQRIPLGYILGTTEFWDYHFKVSPAVLIPRSDTEVLIEEALKRPPPQLAIDVGTGSGCIGLTLACLFPQAHFTLIDISQDALDLAKENERSLRNQGSLQASIAFSLGSLLDSYQKEFPNRSVDLIVSNPPYIRSEEIQTLMPEVKENEPHLALDGGKDGFDLISPLVQSAFEVLNPTGCLLMEVGWDQTKETQHCFEKYGFINTWIRKDYGGNPRVVGGIKPTISD